MSASITLADLGAACDIAPIATNAANAFTLLVSDPQLKCTMYTLALERRTSDTITTPLGETYGWFVVPRECDVVRLAHDSLVLVGKNIYDDRLLPIVCVMYQATRILVKPRVTRLSLMAYFLRPELRKTIMEGFTQCKNGIINGGKFISQSRFFPEGMYSFTGTLEDFDMWDMLRIYRGHQRGQYKDVKYDDDGSVVIYLRDPCNSLILDARHVGKFMAMFLEKDQKLDVVDKLPPKLTNVEQGSTKVRQAPEHHAAFSRE